MKNGDCFAFFCYSKANKKIYRDIMTENEAYTQALSEVNKGTIIDGLWAKSVSLNYGDDKKTTSIYIQLRAEDIIYKNNGYRTKLSLSNVLLVILSPRGKIPLWIFLVVNIFAIQLFAFGVYVIDASSRRNEELIFVIIIPVILLSIWMFIISGVKRARDVGISPYSILIYVIPIAIVAGLWLCDCNFLDFVPTSMQ